MFENLFQVLGDKGQGVYKLFNASFRLLGDQVIRQVVINRVIFTSINYLLGVVAVLLIFCNWSLPLGIVILIGLVVVSYPLSFFYHISRRAYLVGMSYAKITNRTVTLQQAQGMARPQRWRLRTFGLIEVMLANADDGNSQNGGGIFGFATASVMALLRGVYDVAEDYLLPALVIDQITFEDASNKLTQLKQNVSTTLAGAFGLDIFGGVISGALFFPYLMIFLVGAGLSLGLAHIVPPNMTLNIPVHSTTNLTLTHIQLFLPPVIISLIITAWLGALIKNVLTSLKAMYFSIFYTAINHAQEIAPAYKDKVMQYLELAARAAPKSS